MRINIDFDTADEDVAAALARLAAAFSSLSVAPIVAPVATPAPRQRKPKADSAAVTMQAALDAGLVPGKTAETPQPEPVAEAPTPDQIAAQEVANLRRATHDQPESAALSREELLDKVRASFGVGKCDAVWVRQQLADYKVDKLSEMTEPQLVELWAKVQE